MPRFRDDISALSPYQVGRQLEDVARQHGLDPSDIVKLTANEGPDGPFPGVAEAVAEAAAGSNRYPDQDCWEIGHALADELGVDFENLLFGAGSVALITDIVTATSGRGDNIVYGWPSFIMYRFAAAWAGVEYREVPLDRRFALDLGAMREAIDDNTRVVIVCNPNNPTGTLTSSDAVEEFIDSVPESVLVVVDEAYFEFVTDPSYRTEIPLAVTRPNVIVLRTFSKIYALAAHRIGYAVGTQEVLTEVRKAQAPLTVNQMAQTAALASLGQPDELARRRNDNERRRHVLVGALRERNVELAESHTNFLFLNLGESAPDVIAVLESNGVLIRPMSRGWVRATIGNDEENKRLIQALDDVLD